MLLLLSWALVLLAGLPCSAEDSASRVAELAAALPYDAVACSPGTADTAVACAERILIVRVAEWLRWHVAFRSGSRPCAEWCSQATEQGFAYQGHKRFRKGYGNHVFATLNALLGAILSNRSSVLGLDEATRELNTPHLRYADGVAWTVRSLRARYLSCNCPLRSGVEVRSNGPLWHTQQQIAHLKGLAAAERWPLAVDPGSPEGLGLAKALAPLFTRATPPQLGQVHSRDARHCGAHRGDHFLKRGFVELSGLPNAYGLLAYAFLRPSPEVSSYVADAARRLFGAAGGMQVGVHVRVNLHVGSTSHGGAVIQGHELRRKMDPTGAPWAAALVHDQLPTLLEALPGSVRVAVFSDQPEVGATLARRLERVGAGRFAAVALDAAADARDHSKSSESSKSSSSSERARAAAAAAVAAVTAAENDGRFMMHSSDWGAAPRWAALAELWLLSTAEQAVVCSGPYAPSTFCELAAALAAARRAVRRSDADGDRLAPTWRPTNSTAALGSTLVWCPADAHRGNNRDRAQAPRAHLLPRCCEALQENLNH